MVGRLVGWLVVGKWLCWNVLWCVDRMTGIRVSSCVCLSSHQIYTRTREHSSLFTSGADLSLVGPESNPRSFGLRVCVCLGGLVGSQTVKFPQKISWN